MIIVAVSAVLVRTVILLGGSIGRQRFRTRVSGEVSSLLSETAASTPAAGNMLVEINSVITIADAISVEPDPRCQSPLVGRGNLVPYAFVGDQMRSETNERSLPYERAI